MPQRSRMSTHLLLIMEIQGRSFLLHHCSCRKSSCITQFTHLSIADSCHQRSFSHAIIHISHVLFFVALLNLLSNNDRSLSPAAVVLLMCSIVLYHWYVMPLDSPRNMIQELLCVYVGHHFKSRDPHSHAYNPTRIKEIKCII